MRALQLTLPQARGAWFAHQRFGTPSASTRSLGESVGDLGWIPMPSAVTPCVALWSRGVLAHRAQLDDKRAELSVVPGPRGTSWLVPTADAPLARAFATADHASREARIAALVPMSTRELAAARDAIRSAIVTPATPEEIRSRIDPAFMRSLGDVGKKNGVHTLAGMVLRSLWVNGEVARVSGDGRIDAETVRWMLDPRPRTVPSAADAVNVIAPRWLAAHGPMTARTFALAFGIAAGRAHAALNAQHPTQVTIEGVEGEFLAPENFEPPPPDVTLPTVFLPARDPLTDVDLEWLADPDVARGVTLRGVGVGPTVLVGGVTVGAWSYHPARREVVVRPLRPEANGDTVTAEGVRLAAFLHAELARTPLHTPTVPGRARPSAPDPLSIEI